MIRAAGQTYQGRIQKMNKGITEKLQIAASGLTGLRDRDIPYLKGQIREYASDAAVAALLSGILAAIQVPSATTAAA